jgi:hypothetical protein
MQEIIPGVHHWTAFRDTIGMPVSSYWVAPAGVLVDPMLPEGGLGPFESADVPPQQVVLTSGLHTRAAERIAEALSIPIRAPREARDRLGDRLDFEPYTDHEELGPGVRAVRIGVLCPDEYALHIAAAEGAIALADALEHYGDAVGFVSDDLLGDDPAAIKDGLKQQLGTLLERDFDHLLFAHGDPIVGGGKRALRDVVTSAAGHERSGQAH